MRRVSWLAFGISVLSALPAVAQDRSLAEVIDKVKLAHLKSAAVLGTLRVFPAGVSGVLAYPLDDSLIVRGTPAAIAEAKSALAVIDVPFEQGRRLEVTLRRGELGAVGKAALALPKAGTILLRGEKTLRFEGDAEWLDAVRGVVFAAEIADARPIPRL
jgi:hypothetical protein